MKAPVLPFPFFDDSKDWQIKKTFCEETKKGDVYNHKRNKNNQLINYEFYFHDAEADPYDCKCNVDGIEIDTRKYTHIFLNEDLLYNLLDVIHKFESEIHKEDNNLLKYKQTNRNYE
mgnify:CR=1 FL=1